MLCGEGSHAAGSWACYPLGVFMLMCGHQDFLGSLVSACQHPLPRKADLWLCIFQSFSHPEFRRQGPGSSWAVVGFAPAPPRGGLTHGVLLPAVADLQAAPMGSVPPGFPVTPGFFCFGKNKIKNHWGFDRDCTGSVDCFGWY